MPLYDFECTKCHSEFEEFAKLDSVSSVRCKCGGDARIVIKKIGRDWFRPFVSEDFDGTPVLVRTKGHLKELCRKHGVYSRALGYGRNLEEV